MEHTEQLPTSIWYIRMHKETSAIKTAIVQDDLDIVIIHETRYKRRLDGIKDILCLVVLLFYMSNTFGKIIHKSALEQITGY